ncbi:MAG TPA: hypothetical protein IAC31_05965 [Candidatus Faecousia intestinigallinarum]|nr:hypothetical protein [Candidatus Faecousia intestinigallinarum]
MSRVEQVAAALNAAGIPAQATYPSRPLPPLTGIAAAVSLEEVDYAQVYARVKAAVCCPGKLGGAACETAAQQAGDALADLGDVTIGACSFEKTEGYFIMPVWVLLTGKAAFPDWEPPVEPEAPPEFQVQLNSSRLERAAAVTSSQEEDPEGKAALKDTPWKIVLEEEFAPGELETVTAEDTFTLTVRRKTSLERFEECVWTAVYRNDNAQRLRQVRTARAKRRLFTAVVG